MGTIGNIVADFGLYLRVKAEAETIVATAAEFGAPEHCVLPALVHTVAAARTLPAGS